MRVVLDAGLAAVIGAAIGALASPLTTYVVRRFDRAERREEHRSAAKAQTRDALLEVNDAIGGLLLWQQKTDERLNETRRLHAAVAALDLVLTNPEDAEVVNALRRVVVELIPNSDSTTHDGAAAVAMAGHWTRAVARWQRGEIDGRAVFRETLQPPQLPSSAH